MVKKVRMRATSIVQPDASPKFSQQQAQPKGGHVATDYFEMKPCLGGCETLINVKSPWGRFDEKGKEAGVCGIECNQTVLNRRAEEMMAPHH